MDRHVILIEGPDSDTALAELLSNAQYGKLDVIIWVSDNPNEDVIEGSTLAYAAGEAE